MMSGSKSRPATPLKRALASTFQFPAPSSKVSSPGWKVWTLWNPELFNSLSTSTRPKNEEKEEIIKVLRGTVYEKSKAQVKMLQKELVFQVFQVRGSDVGKRS